MVEMQTSKIIEREGLNSMIKEENQVIEPQASYWSFCAEEEDGKKMG